MKHQTLCDDIESKNHLWSSSEYKTRDVKLTKKNNLEKHYSEFIKNISLYIIISFFLDPIEQKIMFGNSLIFGPTCYHIVIGWPLFFF